MQGKVHGFIFTCSKETYAECMLKKVFGLPTGRQHEVSNISPCTPLFLYNISTKDLVCGFEAAGYGKRNVVPGAFKGRYPAQVPIKLTRKLTVQIPFAQYKDIVTFEETSRGKTMKSILNEEQVEKLLEVVERETGEGPGMKGTIARMNRGSVLGLRARPIVNEREDVSVPVHVQDSVGLGLGFGDDPIAARHKKRKLVDSESPRAVSLERIEIPERIERQPIASNGPISEIAIGPVGGNKSIATTVQSAGDEDNTAVGILGQKVDSDVLSHWAWGRESRTTVALHPLPPPSVLDVKSIVSVLDTFCRNSYRFLLVKNHPSIGRVLHVDFLTTTDLVKFHLGVVGKSWRELIQVNTCTPDSIIMHFLDKPQGLSKLKEAYMDKFYLHVGEPSLCPKMHDDIPFFFMIDANQDTPAPVTSHVKGTATNGGENGCPSVGEDVSLHPSSADDLGCDLLVKRYDFSKLFKRMGHLEHARQKCEEEIRFSIQKDIPKIKDIKGLLQQRYDSSHLQPLQGSALFQNIEKIIDTEMDSDLLDMNGPEIDNDVVDSDLDIVG